MKKSLAVVMMTLLALSIVPSARAQQKVIELTYGTAFAADHTFSRADQKWIAKIEKDTNGRVKIKPYWGGQVIGGTNAIDELAAGVADIAYINPVNTKTGFALAKSMQLFFGGANVETGLRVFQQLRAKFPEIDKEYSDAKVKPLKISVTMSTLLTRKPIRKLDDFKGTRIRCMGDWTKVLKVLGSEGVTTSTSEMYTGMQKGLLDGILGLAEGLESMKLADVTKYVNNYDLLAAPCMMRAMNMAKWNSLPPDIQKIFESDVDTWTKETVAVLAAADAQALEYAKKRGVEVLPVSKEDKAQIAKLMVSLAEKDAKDTRCKRIPGNADTSGDPEAHQTV